MKKQITIIFENCRYFDIEADITYTKEDSILEDDRVINNVKIIIDKQQNTIFNTVNNKDISKFNKLEDNDITQIVINNNTYLPVWIDNELNYNTNKCQKTYRNENGDMIIEINT